MLLLPNSATLGTWNLELGMEVKVPYQPPQPPPYDLHAVHKRSTSFTWKNFASEHNPGRDFSPQHNWENKFLGDRTVNASL